MRYTQLVGAYSVFIDDFGCYVLILDIVHYFCCYIVVAVLYFVMLHWYIEIENSFTMDVEISKVGPSASDSTMTDPVSDKVPTETDYKRKRTHSLELDMIKSINTFTHVLNKKMSKQNKRIDPSKSTASNVSPIQSQPSKRSCKAKSQMSVLDDVTLGHFATPFSKEFNLTCWQGLQLHPPRWPGELSGTTLANQLTYYAAQRSLLTTRKYYYYTLSRLDVSCMSICVCNQSVYTQEVSYRPGTTPTIHGSIAAADPATLEPLTVNIDSRAPSQPAPPMQYSDVVQLVTKTIVLSDHRKLNLIVTDYQNPTNPPRQTSNRSQS